MEPKVGLETGSKRFRFAKHPWISMIAFIVIAMFLLLLFAVIGQHIGWFNAGTGFLIAIFVIAPFVMRVPPTTRSFREHLNEAHRSQSGPKIWHFLLAVFRYYRDYLDVIRLTHMRPFLPLLVLGLSCWVVMAFSQAVGATVFRLLEAKPLTTDFLLDTIRIAEDLPPRSASLWRSFGSVFEEVAWRGIFLSFFLGFYSRRKAVWMAALGFSLLHLVNLLGDQEPIWVLGQLVWSFILGLWYGYAVIKTDSLLPVMLVHWLGNAFIGSITHYMQENAGPLEEVLYNMVFMVGLLPVVLMFLWVRFFAAKWPVLHEVPEG